MGLDFYDKLSDLRAAQTETHTLLKGLTEKVDQYIQGDDIRHKELVEFRIESSKNLVSAAEILKDLKKEHDNLVNTTIPQIQTEQAGQKATLNIHTWLIRAIVGATLLAVLGGTVTSLATCEATKINIDETIAIPLDLEDSDIDKEE
jgi:hypothetical protein